MTDYLAELLGETAPAPPPKKKIGRPSNAERAAREAAARGEPTVEEKLRQTLRPTVQMASPDLPDASEFKRPVSIAWLAATTRMDKRTVEDRLRRCPVMAENHRSRGRGVATKEPLFDYMTAMTYLIDPVNFDLERYLLSLSSSTNAHKIPSNLQKVFWDAQNAKSKWMREARQTWADADVLEVFGKVASIIRDHSLLWIENLPGRTNISNADYHALRGEVTNLLTEIETTLVELPMSRKTLSVAATMDGTNSDASSELDDEELVL